VIRLAVRCRPELAERVLADLLELAPGGVEEVGFIADPGGSGGEAEQPTGFYEYAIYGPSGEIPALPELEAAAGDGLVEISSTEIPDDWADRWRDFHEPVAVGGGRIVVRPSWEAGAGSGAEIDVRIDPGQAFGTGAHATTKMCLELLLELADAGQATGPLADLGTGSGVLAIVAANLGWNPVFGVDSEAAAIEAARANAVANGVQLEFERRNLREQDPPEAPTLVANLTAPLLEAVLARLVRPPRVLVCSGLLASETERVSAALAAAGLEPESERGDGDWAALLARGCDRRSG
jgi:ribosomal protein L11 methyltransferase